MVANSIARVASWAYYIGLGISDSRTIQEEEIIMGKSIVRPKKLVGGKRKKAKVSQAVLKEWSDMTPFERHKTYFNSSDNVRFIEGINTAIRPGISRKVNRQVEKKKKKKADKMYEILSKQHKVKYIDIKYSGVTATFDIMLDDTKGSSIDLYKTLKTLGGDGEKFFKYDHRFYVTPFSDGLNIHIDASPDNYQTLYDMKN